MSDFDFRFDLPVEGWADQTVYSFKGPAVDGMDHYLLLALDRTLSDTALDGFATAQINIITSTLKNIETLKRAEITLGRLPAVELVLKWVLQDGLIRYKRYLFVVKEQMGFTFNCDFTKKSFGLLTEQMSQVVRSLLHA